MRTVRFSSPLILLRSYCSKMNSSGLFEVKSPPITSRSNSHSTFLSALCQGERIKWMKQTDDAFTFYMYSKMDSKLYQSGQTFCESRANTSTAKYMCLSKVYLLLMYCLFGEDIMLYGLFYWYNKWMSLLKGCHPVQLIPQPLF